MTWSGQEISLHRWQVLANATAGKKLEEPDCANRFPDEEYQREDTDEQYASCGDLGESGDHGLFRWRPTWLPEVGLPGHCKVHVFIPSIESPVS